MSSRCSGGTSSPCHVAADPGLALDLAIFLMIDRDAGYSSEKSGSSLVTACAGTSCVRLQDAGCAATIARAEAADGLDRSWTEGRTRSERFDRFRSLGEEARAAWLGHAVARTLEASVNLPGARSCAFHDHLGRLIGIDVAQWWRPTGANFFDRVPKGVTLAALEEIGGAALAARYVQGEEGRARAVVRADLLGRLHRGDRRQGGRARLGAAGGALRVRCCSGRDRRATAGDTRSRGEGSGRRGGQHRPSMEVEQAA
jgi:ParB family chromosome partitioning protein